MKKWLCLLGMLVFLSGCSDSSTYETMEDVPLEPVSSQAMEILLEIPEEASSQVMQTEDGSKLYFAPEYTICVQVLEAGDLHKTLQNCTGFGRDALDVIETKSGDLKRYEAVWVGVGEGGDQLGRIAVLDDGNYHYTVTVMADAENAGDLTDAWQTMFRSFRLQDPGEGLNNAA